jgi:hypothetical protein
MKIGDSTMRERVSRRRRAWIAAASATLAVLLGTRQDMAVAQQAGSTSSITSTAILVDGQPFFPVGFYGLNWSLPLSDRIAALDTIAAAGFNTIVAEDIGTPSFGSLLDRAQEKNIRVMVGGSSLPDNQYIVSTVNSYKLKPAVLAWSLFDDADSFDATQLQQRSQIVKSIDAQHFTFAPLTGYTPQRRQDKAPYIAATDLSSLQMYPITPLPDYYFEYGGNPLLESFRATEQYVQAAAQTGKPFITNPQTFRWNVPGGRYPTVKELRNMVYGQLMAGAKGIISYDFSNDLVTNQPALWSEYIALKSDVLGPLNGALLRGVRRQQPTGNPNLFVTTWTYNSDLYVMALNASLTESVDVSIPLQSIYLGRSTPISPRFSNTVTAGGGQIRGVLPPTEVVAFKVGGSSEPTFPPRATVPTRGSRPPRTRF